MKLSVRGRKPPACSAAGSRAAGRGAGDRGRAGYICAPMYGGGPASGGAGFTFIEVLLSAAVVATLAVIGVANYRSAARQIDLQAQTQQIISVLQVARSRTLASLDGSQYGVHLEGGAYTLFAGDA